MTKRISNSTGNDKGLAITVDGNEKFFSWLWLRDHSQEPDSYHQKARQRLLETFHLGQVGPASAIEVADDGNAISVGWDGGGVSKFTAAYLAAVDTPMAAYDIIGSDQILWSRDTAAGLCKAFQYEDFLNDDGVLAEALENIRRCGLISLKKVPTEIPASRRAMERIAYIRSSIFGEMWELKADGKIADTGSTPLEIKPHTDGTYNHDAPGLMMLHCLAYDAEGGDNVLVDGFYLANKIRQERPDAYEVLSTTAVAGQYIGDGSYLVAQRPPLHHDTSGRLVQVSFNNHDRAPFRLPEPQMGELYAALSVFDAMAQDRANQFAFGQRPGDMVIFDNWRLLHGRLAFKGQRHMVGCYLNREDFESRMRMLASRPLDMVA